MRETDFWDHLVNGRMFLAAKLFLQMKFFSETSNKKRINSMLLWLKLRWAVTLYCPLPSTSILNIDLHFPTSGQNFNYRIHCLSTTNTPWNSHCCFLRSLLSALGVKRPLHLCPHQHGYPLFTQWLTWMGSHPHSHNMKMKMAGQDQFSREWQKQGTWSRKLRGRKN